MPVPTAKPRVRRICEAEALFHKRNSQIVATLGIQRRTGEPSAIVPTIDQPQYGPAWAANWLNGEPLTLPPETDVYRDKKLG